MKEYQQVQSSHVDPTVDSDNDFKEAPLSDELVACVGLGECGASGCVEFTAADAENILRVSRSSGKVIPKRDDVGSTEVDHSDFIDICSLVFGLRMSVHPCPGELRRVLAQDWVRMWVGWTESSAMSASASDCQDENQIAEDVVVRFSRISIDNVHERFMSDQHTQLMLLDEGLHLGKR